MEQATLVRELYRACLEHDRDRERQLLHVETVMVLSRRAESTSGFDGTWTIVSGTCGDVGDVP